MSTIQEVIERRGRAEQAVVDALAHLPRSRALSVVMSYIGIARLEEVLPTIVGSEPPVKDPVEAFAVRLRMACTARDLQPIVVVLKDGRRGAKARKPGEMEKLVKEAFAEALT
jgi:hypothetical protein